MAERLGNGLQNRVQQFESAWDLIKRALRGVPVSCWWGGRSSERPYDGLRRGLPPRWVSVITRSRATSWGSTGMPSAMNWKS